jgi:hypothetical protein
MTSGKRLAVAFGITLLTAFGSVSAAQAQYAPRPYYAPPPPRGVYRSGLVFGGSIGAGATASSGCGVYCGGSGMIEGHLGGMLNPRLALVGDFFGSVHPWDDGIYTGQTYQGLFTFAAQYWATDILWLKGGVGFSHLQFGYDGDIPLSDESGLALMAAVGVELVQSYNFTLDGHLRLGRGVYSTGPDVNNIGLMIGVNWY